MVHLPSIHKCQDNVIYGWASDFLTTKIYFYCFMDALFTHSNYKHY